MHFLPINQLNHINGPTQSKTRLLLPPPSSLSLPSSVFMPLFQMSTSKTLIARTALSSSFHSALHRSKRPFPSTNPSPLALASSPPLRSLGLGFHVPNPYSSPPKLLSSQSSAAAAAAEDPSDSSDDTVEELLTRRGDQIERLMKMERRSEPEDGDRLRCRWFPYCDLFRSGIAALRSREVIAALDPYILEARKEKIQRAVENRSYSVCLVVEGLTDFGNVSAAFRSADALGIQSVHVISRDGRKRYRDNRHVSMGAEKWLDIELWNSPTDCFTALRKRGYRIATSQLGIDAVSIYEMDWSHPIAIVVGNEHMGITEEALQLSDLHCSIPMKGMVDSFNVSVAAGILMHHAVCDRISRLGRHGDLTSEESQILQAEFYLRHRENTIGIVHEYAKRKMGGLLGKV